MGCADPFSYCVVYWTVVNINHIEKVLNTYSLEDILELNELTEADVLHFLVEEEFVTLPKPEPLDFDD